MSLIFCAFSLLVFCLFKLQVEATKRKNQGHQKWGTVGRFRLWGVTERVWGESRNIRDVPNLMCVCALFHIDWTECPRDTSIGQTGHFHRRLVVQKWGCPAEFLKVSPPKSFPNLSPQTWTSTRQLMRLNSWRRAPKFIHMNFGRYSLSLMIAKATSNQQFKSEEAKKSLLCPCPSPSRKELLGRGWNQDGPGWPPLGNS